MKQVLVVISDIAYVRKTFLTELDDTDEARAEYVKHLEATNVKGLHEVVTFSVVDGQQRRKEKP